MDFFEQNDAKVNDRLTKILLWMTLVFPVLMVLTLLNVFHIKMVALAILTVIGVIATIVPTILKKCNVKPQILKYVSVLSMGFVVMLLGTNASIGIYMTYALTMAISCMYFDKKFTLRVAIISTVLLAISLFFRAPGAAAKLGETAKDWYFPHLMGFLIEQVIMSIVFVTLAAASRVILENLHSSEQVVTVVERCEEASKKLVGMVGDLATNMEEARAVSNNIVEAAQNTYDDCSESLEHVGKMQESVQHMTDAVNNIGEQTKEMNLIANNVSDRMYGYTKRMDITVESMRTIEKAANGTNEAIQQLENGIEEIMMFADEIDSIAEQTNLLSLNASIEAARAGESGKGFAVVADEVRKLAEHSKDSSNSITDKLSTVREQLEEVKKHNYSNIESVASGIKQIFEAKDESIKIGELQAESQRKTQIITENTEETRRNSLEVIEMTKQMHDLVENSRIRVENIVEHSSEQENINNRTNETFNSVESVAKDLLELSNI